MSSKTVNQVDDSRPKVLMEGYLRKLKTMKKKFFVLRGDGADAPSGLEYYDSEKKYRLGQQPKRRIELKMCFNINRCPDKKHKYVIALFNKDDIFCVVLETENQLQEWLQLLLILQNGGEDLTDDYNARPNYEHTWKVKLQDKGLGISQNMVGPYYLCLSDLKLCLVKQDTLETKEFPLTQIRSCGGTESFFYMEVGRQSCTGAGELWMHTDDPNIAKNMSEVIQRAFTRDRDTTDPHRKRSCSATEMNRPVGMLHRRLTQGNGKLVSPYPVAPNCCYTGRPSMLAAVRPASLRRHSVSAVSSCTSGAVPPAHVDVTDAPSSSTAISHQRTKSCPVSDSSLPIIVEPYRVMSQSHVCYPYPDGDRRGSGSAYRRHGSAKCTTGTRERCDSMPSRNRTTSEGTHKSSLVRPTSMRVSYSPPGPCSTDSAGSSLSIDEAEHAATPDENTIFEEVTDEALHWPADPELEAEKLDKMSLGYDRPPASLSLPIGGRGRKVSTTSLAHGSSCGSSPAHNADYTVMSPGTSESTRRVRPGCSPSATYDYMPMSPGDGHRKTVGSPSSTSDYLPFSPADRHRPGTVTSSPSYQSDYMAMSPAGSRTSATASMDYLPMSPGDMNPTKRAVSRDAAPAHSDDGYVDMDPLLPHLRSLHYDHHSDMSPDSSSITSGTPSSDHYLLEKVSAAYFTQSEEEDGQNGRPSRTYSFGSQPLRRLDPESDRVRAFSMGNQQRPNGQKLTTRPTNTVKFSSAPLLCTSLSVGNRAHHADPLADHMEMDFSKKSRTRYRNLPVVESLVTQKTSSADSGYMDMSSKSPPGASPPKPSSTKHLFSPPDGKSSLGRKPPHVIASTTLKTIGEKPDIKPQKFPNTTRVPDKPHGEQKQRTVSNSSVDGYMDMTPNAYKLARKNSSDYLPMQPGRKLSDASEYMALSCPKRSSQPIAIVTSSSPTVRSESITSPPQPPNFLPLNPSSTTSSLNLFSLRRKRKNRKKNERRDSKENITTAAGIFSLSLNSPQSPKKPQCAEASASSSLAVESESLVTPLSRVLRISENAASAVVDDGDYATIRPVPQTWTPSSQQESASGWLSRGSHSDAPSRLSGGESRGRNAGNDGTCESCRLKGTTTGTGIEAHSGVSRQVSTSSSSSTEVVSVKEGACGGAGERERDITYVALDLPVEGDDPRSPRPSPAPSPALAGEPFSYAEIDFQKSESLRAPAHSYRKIRH